MEQHLELFEEKMKEAMDYAKENLNPHQAIIITVDGAKLVSTDCFVPSRKE